MGSSIQQRKWTLILVFLSRSRSGWVECSSSPRYQILEMQCGAFATGKFTKPSRETTFFFLSLSWVRPQPMEKRLMIRWGWGFNNVLILIASVWILARKLHYLIKISKQIPLTGPGTISSQGIASRQKLFNLSKLLCQQDREKFHIYFFIKVSNQLKLKSLSCNLTTLTTKSKFHRPL